MNKPVDFFKRKLVESKNCITNFVSTTRNDNENALEASYRVSYRVAKASEAHVIAENLICSCIKDVVQCMLGGEAAKKMALCIFPIMLCHEELRYVETAVVQRVKESQYYIMLFSWMNQRVLLT
jgi:hypothetical protein